MALLLTPTALWAAFLSLLILLVFRRLRRPKNVRLLNLPPGPPGWPVVGNLLQAAFSGKHFIHHVRDLCEAHGPIFTLRMGARTLIVVSRADLAHEALVEQGPLFAGRPAEGPTRSLFSNRQFTVNSAPYGPTWRALRRNMVSGVLGPARLRDFQPVREWAVGQLVDRIRAEADASSSPDGASVRVRSNVRFAAFSILLSMTFGLIFDDDEILRIDGIMKRVLLSVSPRMDDYLPLLRPFFFFARRRAEALAVRREQIEALVPLINRRRAILRCGAANNNNNNHSNNNDNDVAPFSYLDSLLDLRVEGRGNAPPTDDELVSLCSEFINAGTDTTATAVEWAMARIIESPAIQARLYEDIAANVGKTRPVDEADVENMPYLQAFVKELLRKHPPTHFLLSHAVSADSAHPARLGGYDIPTDASVEIFVPAISEDPKLWTRPTEFSPDRFLTDGESADLTGSKGVRMIPFGAGRRICPGLGLGITHIGLIVARMVQAFKWQAHPSQPDLNFKDDEFEFTVVMKRPLLAMVRPRNMN